MSARRAERFRRGPLPVAVAVVTLGAFAAPAHAGTLQVTTAADQYGSKPGECSLREAIVATNGDIDFGGCNDSGGDDVVDLDPKTYKLTRPGSDEDAARTGDLDITASLRVRGAGAGATTIDGNRAQVGDRVLEVHSGAIVKIAAVTVKRGGADQDTGGGIRGANGSDLTIEDSVVRDNVADGGAGGVSGQGALTIRDSVIRDNRTPLAGGGVSKGGAGTLLIEDSQVIGNETGVFGGGVYTNPSATIILRSTVRDNKADAEAGGIAQLAGSLQVTNSVIKDNRSRETGAEGGGGIHGQSTTISIDRSTVSDNRTTANGGGIFVYGSSGQLNIDQTTVSKNRARGDGGGVRVVDGQATITNTTISGNRAKDDGGGLHVGLTSNDTETTLGNVTIADNLAGIDLVAGGDGGGFYQQSGPLYLFNTLVGDNRDINPPAHPDCSGGIGVVFSLIEEADEEDGCIGLGMENVLGQDPKLKPLADNGGPTLTHALKAGSPALEMGSTATPGSGGNACEPSDQRGTPRPEGPRCDIGAFEREAP